MARSELLHDVVSLLLWHITMHRAYCEVRFLHFLCEPVNLPLGVAEDDCLSYSQCIIEITQCVKLPLFTFDCYKELLNAFKCQLITESENNDLSTLKICQ